MKQISVVKSIFGKGDLIDDNHTKDFARVFDLNQKTVFVCLSVTTAVEGNNALTGPVIQRLLGKTLRE